VSTSTAVPLHPTTPAQRRRRDLILDTAVSLVEERGPDGFQVREVVERSGVALGTIYRYFPSKDYLIAEALDRATSDLRERLATATRNGEREGGSADPAERIADLLRIVAESIERRPGNARASLQLMLSADPIAEVAQHDFRDAFGAALEAALADVEPSLATDLTVVASSLLTEHVVAVATGRPSVGGTELQMERGIRVLQLAIHQSNRTASSRTKEAP
jgi:TetR/AcrR family transcriptional regulator, cholesterol catabolism regulator